MKKIELLSPAGDFESLKMAVHAGCDAIYLGGKHFGARAFSKNFDNDEIIEAINYCHLYGVKVYVTVNTLIYEEEIDEVVNYIDFLYKNRVDAILVQDLGLASIIRSMFPNLELHASTQMNIHTIKQLKLLKELGFKRVVLAREVDIDTIRQMKKEVDIEIEVFVQGALCVSASGECLMSYMIGGRSANRGECAGSCRQRYSLYKNDEKIDIDDEYLLSTKDLCLIDKLDELIEIGVDSLKIEGRMKSKEYVSLVTRAYRLKIDNKYNNEIEDVKKVFYRGFTYGNMYNKKGKDFINGERPNHIGYEIGEVIDYKKNKVLIKLSDELNQGDGIRFITRNELGFIVNKMYVNDLLVNKADRMVTLDLNDKVSIGTKVYKTLDSKLIKSIDNSNLEKRILIDGIFKVENRSIILEVTDGINKEIIKLDNVIEKATSKPTTEYDILEKLNKTGNTPYEFKNLDIKVPDNIFIPISIINNIRRDILDKLSNDRINFDNKYVKNDYNLSLKDTNIDNIISIEVTNEEQLKYILDNTNFDVYTYNYNLYLKYNNDRVKYKKSRYIISDINTDKEMLVGDISSINNNISDTYLNVLNSYTIAFLQYLGAKRITLSYELSNNQIKNTIDSFIDRYGFKPNLELVIYGKPEVMISKYCVINTYLGNGEKTNCNLCKSDNYYLADRFDNKYRLKPSYDCLMRISNYKDIDKIDEVNELKEIGITSYRLIFTDEKVDEIKSVLSRLK